MTIFTVKLVIEVKRKERRSKCQRQEKDCSRKEKYFIFIRFWQAKLIDGHGWWHENKAESMTKNINKLGGWLLEELCPYRTMRKSYNFNPIIIKNSIRTKKDSPFKDGIFSFAYFQLYCSCIVVQSIWTAVGENVVNRKKRKTIQLQLIMLF